MEIGNTISAAACLLSFSEVEFGENGENARTVPIKLLARSSQAIFHKVWGNVVHDFAGMQRKSRIPLDYVHGEPIGYLNKFEVTPDGLVVSGAIVPTKDPNDPAPRLIERQRGGVPYEASINWGGDGIVYELYDDGETVEVNGVQFSGPLTVIREWPLRGVAVCPYGADMYTESKFSQSAETFTATIREKAAMADEVKPVTPEAETPAVESGADTPKSAEAPAETPAAVEAQAPTTEPASETPDPRAEAKRFHTTFGDKGALWFAQGLSFDECFAKRIAEQDIELAELRQKLSTPKVDGESTPVEFKSTDETPVRKGPASKIKFAGAAVKN